MKKTIFLVILLVGILFYAGTFFHNRTKADIGKEAPEIALEEADSAVSSDCRHGDYVILNFWSSTDAPSREAANLYTAWVRRNPDAEVALVGVNFDESEALFREIVRRDSLVPDRQYYAAGDTAEAIIKKYGLEEGLGSVLIDPQGKIIAHNPTDATLDNIIHTH